MKHQRVNNKDVFNWKMPAAPGMNQEMKNLFSLT